ncbi:DNA-binding CsgD family transcriptional regulator/tetratricopeptide (TPR) repeat protein/nucleoside-triphosphatase THEP1 [Paenarthrobacter nitroguajacolicus]|uniref:helix-turn-helix transcriptional regulator n=1 Tax=Paenarthrobacter TaxID=1742992 RepID=UPI002865EBC2|nr:LuxR C-terminal-related transcriptional regulator [Paenarthrobacter nitroguajacolicus]MDR6985826.1 DNA-binding CsgD family transcriptional regulator/tetratricopeptide (TPR) repeat protein/nucleoside-triphosphatase THEP1 [Paenarthrobacter nitroguajacolicus]
MSAELLNKGGGGAARAAAPDLVGGPTDRQTWSLLARSHDLSRAGKLLESPDSYGVVLTGQRGIGKSGLARAVVSSLGPKVHSLQLRNTVANGQTPYGCLGFLLARLPSEAVSSPTGILHAVTSLIRTEAAGRDTVLIVDNAGGMDPMSTGVLLNLMATGTAKVVATVQRASDLPADFHRLVLEGELGEVHLNTLSEEQTKQVLGSVLGHYVSSTLVGSLHSAVGGNPMLLHALLEEQRHSGNLVLNDSVWTLRDRIKLEGATVVEDFVRSRLARETQASRTVVEILACAQRATLMDLAAIFGTEVLVEMEDSGLLTVERCGDHWVSLRDPYVGEVVRGWLSTRRRRELRLMLHGPKEPELRGLAPQDLLSYAAWMHSCEDEPMPSPAHALAAGRAALDDYDPNFAIQCTLSLDPKDTEWVPGQRLKAAAYLMLDLPLHAAQALDEVSEAHIAAVDPVEFAEITAAKCQAMTWIDGRAGMVPGVISDGLETLEAMADNYPAGTVAKALNRLHLCNYEYNTYMGEYASIIDALEEELAKDPEADREHWLRCSFFLIEARCILGREVEAQELARTVSRSLGDTDRPAQLEEAFARHAFLVLLLSGQWRQCIELMRRTPSRSSRLQYRGALTELGIGLAYAYAGKPANAIEPLRSAVAQLELRPAMNMNKVAYAATAFAYAQVGNSVEAGRYLDLYRTCRGVGTYFSESVSEFCAEMAGRWMGDPDVKQRLLARVRNDIEKQRLTTAGICLFGATVEGTDEEYRLLEDIARRRQGPLAEISGNLARGALTRSSRSLLDAADAAATLDLLVVEARCVAMALDFARDAGETTAARTAQLRLERLEHSVSALPIQPRSDAPVLTERERQIAKLAGKGVSNREIAMDIGVSVRTVEGHLYQVFTKLGVSSRGELNGLL